MRAPDSLELRRLALAVSVLDDVDIVPLEDGLLLTGETAVEVSWLELRRALAGADLDDTIAGNEHGRARVLAWLRGRRIAADIHEDHLCEVARPVGLPVDHPLHPGLDWVRHRVLGGTLDLGLGFVGVGPDPDEVVVVPQGALDAAGVDPSPWWPGALDYLERMGTIAAQRLASGPVLRPIGDCDVVTLLGSHAFRVALGAQDGTGMRAAAVPMRRRGRSDGPGRAWLQPAGARHRRRGLGGDRGRPPGRDRAARPRRAGAAPASHPVPLSPPSPCPTLAPCPAPRTR